MRTYIVCILLLFTILAGGAQGKCDCSGVRRKDMCKMVHEPVVCDGFQYGNCCLACQAKAKSGDGFNS